MESTIQITSNTATISPLEALMAHFNASSKSVQRAFSKFIIESHADELEEARQKAMVKQSLNQAMAELKAGMAHPIDQLFNEL